MGKRLGLVIRGEGADDLYTTSFIESLLTHESGGLFDVRGAILGHVQQGGAPSPFDRIQATRLAAAAVDHLIAQALSDGPPSAMVGHARRQGRVHPAAELPDLIDHSGPAATPAGMVDGAAPPRRHHGVDASDRMTISAVPSMS